MDGLERFKTLFPVKILYTIVANMFGNKHNSTKIRSS